MILRRNQDRLEGDTKFRMRYGLLYFGFRRERAWWECVIAARKVAVVLIGTFGTLSNSVNLQA